MRILRYLLYVLPVLVALPFLFIWGGDPSEGIFLKALLSSLFLAIVYFVVLFLFGRRVSKDTFRAVFLQSGGIAGLVNMVGYFYVARTFDFWDGPIWRSEEVFNTLFYLVNSLLVIGAGFLIERGRRLGFYSLSLALLFVLSSVFLSPGGRLHFGFMESLFFYTLAIQVFFVVPLFNSLLFLFSLFIGFFSTLRRFTALR